MSPGKRSKKGSGAPAAKARARVRSRTGKSAAKAGSAGRGKIERMIARIEAVADAARAMEQQYAAELAAVHPAFAQSALNLVHYRALRSQDIRDLQKKLEHLGLSRLARTESHVVASLQASHGVLRRHMGSDPVPFEKAPVSIRKGEKLLRKNAKALLGYRSKGRRVRIMVTLPSEAAVDRVLVDDLVGAGMNTARINCAHDGPEEWLAMVGHVREAAAKHRRAVRICMDLAGPKIRTGSMQDGPEVITFAPPRDALGRYIGSAPVWLAPAGQPPDPAMAFLPVPPGSLDGLRAGDRLGFRDARGRPRTLAIADVTDAGCLALANARAFVTTGTLLRREGKQDGFPVGRLPPVEQSILLNTGDTLILRRDPRPGTPEVRDAEGRIAEPASISCTSAAIFEAVEPGERVLFDDGKIEGVARRVTKESIEVEVTWARPGGQKLRADKGINLPDSDLRIRGLTDKDRSDLAFIAQHADVVNMSFVNAPGDVHDLLRAIESCGAPAGLGVILKIETQSGFDHLTEILLAAMTRHPLGVMIARGDLAVETGWENMPRIQEEILSLCLAAHVPQIWATQVLDSLAKKGLPSRAEVTDAAMAQRADCVMLNKGPHIVRAIHMMDEILKNMKEYQDRKMPMLPAMEVRPDRATSHA